MKKIFGPRPQTFYLQTFLCGDEDKVAVHQAHSLPCSLPVLSQSLQSFAKFVSVCPHFPLQTSDPEASPALVGPCVELALAPGWCGVRIRVQILAHRLVAGGLAGPSPSWSLHFLIWARGGLMWPGGTYMFLNAEG